MTKSMYAFSTTELKWIINALNLYTANVKAEMEEASDDSPIQAIGECVLQGREGLVLKITDIIESGAKTVKII